jgi:transcriptional regulator with GAF, ATPase, and Fis domain
MNMNSLQEVVLAIAQQRSVATVLQRIVDDIGDCETGEAATDDCADIALVRIWLIAPGDLCATCPFRPECLDQSQCLHLSASSGKSQLSSDRWTRIDGAFRRFPIGVRKIGKIAASGQPIIIPDLATDSQWITQPQWVQSEGIRCFAGHPLVFRGETLGVLGTFSRTAFRNGDTERLHNFANHAAVAIANARAFEEIESLRARIEKENDYLRDEVATARGAGELIGDSSKLRHVMQQVRRVAPTDATVLVTGESGTGKELVARAIHAYSDRSERPLITVNCGAIPETLFEAEFFGHVKGAFTGALKDRPGRFELADRGTLFLDEIGEVPWTMQAKLLRVLQEQEVERVGDSKTLHVNVRIIAATNRDLAAEVAAGRFRADLFYRLHVFPLELPALRARPDDIEPLAMHFARLAARRMRRPVPALDPSSLQHLLTYAWPGNVRELQNAVERAVILWQGGPLYIEAGPLRRHVSPLSEEIAPTISMTDDLGASTTGPRQPIRARLRRLERDAILAALAETGGRVFGAGGAAELLGMKPTTLASRIITLDIPRPRNSDPRSH